MVRHAFIIATALSVAAPAFAATVNVVPGTPLAGQGLTTSRGGTTQENYNAPGTPTTCIQEQPSQFQIVTGLQGDTYDFVVGSVQNMNLSPANDSSCYISFGRDISQVAVLGIDFNPSGPPTNAQYVGFYWGSIDEYNFVQAFNDAGDVIPFTGFGPTPVEAFSGAELAAAFGFPLYTSQYVELRFSLAEDLRVVEFTTFNFAFEIDNFAQSGAAVPLVGRIRPPAPFSLADQQALIASGNPVLSLEEVRRLDAIRRGVVFQVPEPASALLVLGGLALVGVARRRRAA